MVDQAAPRSTSLEVLTEIATVVRDAADASRAISAVLEVLCSAAGLPLAHAVIAVNEDKPQHIWFPADGHRYQDLRSVTESMPHALPVLVDASTPVCIEDLAVERDSPRADAALAEGLRSVVTVPVFAEARQTAALELFAENRAGWDPRTLGLFTVAAAELTGVLERVCARSRADAQLRRYRMLFQDASDAILLVRPDGTLIDGNPSACRLLGYSADRLAGVDVRAICAPEWLDVLELQLARTLGEIEEHAASYELVLVAVDGARIPVEVRSGALREGGVVVGTQVVVRDTRERKRVEHALVESETRFRGAFEASPIGMALVAVDGRWLKVNEPLCRLVGYTAAEMLTMRWQDITHPDDLAQDVELCEQTIRDQRAGYQLEKRYIHRNGPTIWIHLAVTLVRDAAGAPAYFVSQVHDISEQKRLAPDGGGLADRLTPREREVMALLAQGNTSAEAGRLLSVSQETVQTHVRHSMRKLRARSRTHAVAIAIRLGILDELDLYGGRRVAI